MARGRANSLVVDFADFTQPLRCSFRFVYSWVRRGRSQRRWSFSIDSTCYRPPMMIRAGTLQELHAHDGDWLFVDLGFSSSARSCGYLQVFANGSADNAKLVKFGDLLRTVTALVECRGPPLHLVLEAPLSAAFGPDDNPVGRSIERRGANHRYWYNGLGCQVLVASLFLLRAIVDARPVREVRLFEGLVSFKDRTKLSDHKADARLLKDVVWSGGLHGGKFREAEPLPGVMGGSIRGTCALFGLDIGIPPIVEVISLPSTIE
jgi:hypothetical protein